MRNGRVNGLLATSRAFGDFKYKRKDKSKYQRTGNGEDLVSAKPEIRVHEIDYTQDEFLIIACDGLFDCLSNQEVVSFTHEKLSESPIAEQDTTVVVRELVKYADKKSNQVLKASDNISAILVPLTRGISAKE